MGQRQKAGRESMVTVADVLIGVLAAAFMVALASVPLWPPALVAMVGAYVAALGATLVVMVGGTAALIVFAEALALIERR